MKIDGVWDERGLKEEKQHYVFSIAVSHLKQEYTHKLKIFLFSTATEK